MRKHRVAWKYLGYMREKIVAVDEEIDGLDLAATCQHWTSWGGACDEIVKGIQGLLYRIQETWELPDWCDVRRLMTDGRYRHNVLELSRLSDPDAGSLARLAEQEEAMVEGCVKILIVRKFRSDFRRSLRRQVDAWLDGGSKYDTPLSPRQVACLSRRYR